MRYVISGLVGFFLTLVLSIPLQQLIRLREAQALTMRAKSSGSGVSSQSTGSITVEVAPLGQASRDVRKPRIKFLPQYPAEAVEKQLEGYVMMTYAIARDGSVKNLKVISSQPPTVFDEEARRAVSRWNFAPNPNQTAEVSEEVTLRLVFSIKRNLASE